MPELLSASELEALHVTGIPADTNDLDEVEDAHLQDIIDEATEGNILEQVREEAKPEVLTAATVGNLRIEPVEQPGKNITLLIYGDTSVGKTVLAGSAAAVPEMCPVLLIDVEGGTLSLSTTYPQVQRVRIKSMAEMQAVYDDLYKHPGKFKTVIIDSLSELQQFAMDRIMDDTVKSDPDRDPDVPAQREWGKNLSQVKGLVRAFRDLPEMNTIFTCLATEKENKRTGMTSTVLQLSGKAQKLIPGYIDEVFYLYIKRKDEKETRLLLTKNIESTLAKDRLGTLPRIIENPTMTILFELLTKDI